MDCTAHPPVPIHRRYTGIEQIQSPVTTARWQQLRLEAQSRPASNFILKEGAPTQASRYSRTLAPLHFQPQQQGFTPWPLGGAGWWRRKHWKMRPQAFWKWLVQRRLWQTALFDVDLQLIDYRIARRCATYAGGIAGNGLPADLGFPNKLCRATATGLDGPCAASWARVAGARRTTGGTTAMSTSAPCSAASHRTFRPWPGALFAAETDSRLRAGGGRRSASVSPIPPDTLLRPFCGCLRTADLRYQRPASR